MERGAWQQQRVGRAPEQQQRARRHGRVRHECWLRVCAIGARHVEAASCVLARRKRRRLDDGGNDASVIRFYQYTVRERATVGRSVQYHVLRVDIVVRGEPVDQCGEKHDVGRERCLGCDVPRAVKALRHHHN
eukprot:4136001-Prymnesium_polylepis.1